MKISLQNALIFFLLGAYLYGLIEVLFRGYTHPTMMVAGGVSLCFIRLISQTKLRFIYKCLICGIIITAIEFLFGIIFNIILHLNIWDYSQQPFNILGQVCPQFLGIWCLISGVALFLSKLIEKELLNKKQIFH